MTEGELPPWDDNRELLNLHKELHHYTSREGLKGILQTNSLWATHFSNLSDSSELFVLKEPFEVDLSRAMKLFLIRKMKGSFKERRNIDKFGGADVVSRSLAHDLIDAVYEVAFRGGPGEPLAEAFITSFCSHAKDQKYEQENGLLSQWRGYGRGGRYALVFDAHELDALLAEEWRAHYWAFLSIREVKYLDAPQNAFQYFPGLLDAFQEVIKNRLEASPIKTHEWITLFVHAATILKHRGFHEEREIRIVGVPHSTTAIKEPGWQEHLRRYPQPKPVQSIGSRRYLALFDTLSRPLPIKRIIIGPGANQKDDCDFAKSLVSGKTKVICSETPYTA